MIALGIDTSCDDTSVAVLNDNTILSNIVSSQVALHSHFGGIVPELASRKHVELIDAISRQALTEAGVSLREIDIIGVTQGPGLIGSLLVGLCYAKGLGLATDKPLVGVNHIEAHAMSIVLERDIAFPLVSLVVSGGHTLLLLFSDHVTFRMLGSTRDDAVGEAFDKIAKYLGLGYPGGKVIEELALNGDPRRVAFPRPMGDEDNYDFSFSGLKTAFINYVKKNGVSDEDRSDILASFQEAACDVLSAKTLKAAQDTGVKTVVVGGGVACNMRLREMITARCSARDIAVCFPSPALCTDNGAMVAVAAGFRARRGLFSGLDMMAFSRMKWG